MKAGNDQDKPCGSDVCEVHRKNNVAYGKDHLGTFPGDQLADECELTRTMYPILLAMKVCGLYFKSDSNDYSTQCHSCWSSAKSACNDISEQTKAARNANLMSRKTNWPRVYAVVTLAVSWFTTIRMLFAFNSSDKTLSTEVINKLALTGLYVQCSICHASCFIACHTGQLDALLHELRIGVDCVKSVKKRTALILIYGVMVAFGNTVVAACALFLGDNVYDFLLAPLAVHIPVPASTAVVMAAKIVYLIMDAWVKLGFTFSFLMAYSVISNVLYQQFESFNDRFTEFVKAGARTPECLRIFRHRHHSLCQAVAKADHMTMLMNASTFGCYMFIIVVLLYGLIFGKYSNWVTSVPGMFLFPSCLMGLYACILLSIWLNHQVHKVCDRIYDIDLAKLDDANIRELMMFEKRLSGDPIGTSVLGIFVITRNTFLTILGMLITYFMLVVQLTSPVKCECCIPSVNDTQN